MQSMRTSLYIRWYIRAYEHNAWFVARCHIPCIMPIFICSIYVFTRIQTQKVLYKNSPHPLSWSFYILRFTFSLFREHLNVNRLVDATLPCDLPAYIVLHIFMFWMFSPWTSREDTLAWQGPNVRMLNGGLWV